MLVGQSIKQKYWIDCKQTLKKYPDIPTTGRFQI